MTEIKQVDRKRSGINETKQSFEQEQVNVS